MGPEDVIVTYERVGLAWAGQRNQDLVEQPWLDRMLTLVTADQPRILDLGCGAGKPIATYLAAQGALLTGVDTTAALCELYRTNVPGSAAIEADMRTLKLGQSFDAIVVWDSFFHLSAQDQRQMFATFASHSELGTALLFTSGPAAGEAIGEVAGQPIYHASLAPDEYRALLAQHGFGVEAYVPEDPTCANHTVWLAQKQA